MAAPFSLESLAMPEEGQLCPWCSSPLHKGQEVVRVSVYPSSLPENLRGLFFHSLEHLRNWAQQASLNAMRLIATNDPTYIAHRGEVTARRDAYSALVQMTFPERKGPGH